MRVILVRSGEALNAVGKWEKTEGAGEGRRITFWRSEKLTLVKVDQFAVLFV